MEKQKQLLFFDLLGAEILNYRISLKQRHYQDDADEKSNKPLCVNVA